MTIQRAFTEAVNKGWKPIRVWLSPSYYKPEIRQIYGIPVQLDNMLRISRVVCENGEVIYI